MTSGSLPTDQPWRVYVWRHDLWQPAIVTMLTDQVPCEICDVMSPGSLPTDQRCQRTNVANVPTMRELYVSHDLWQPANDANAPTMRRSCDVMTSGGHTKLPTMPSCQSMSTDQPCESCQVMTSGSLLRCQRTNVANGPTMRECVITSWLFGSLPTMPTDQLTNETHVHTCVSVDGIKLSLCLLYPMSNVLLFLIVTNFCVIFHRYYLY